MVIHFVVDENFDEALGGEELGTWVRMRPNEMCRLCGNGDIDVNVVRSCPHRATIIDVADVNARDAIS